MPFLIATNPTINWKEYTLQFSTGNANATVPVGPGQVRPNIQEVSAKTMAKLERQQGRIAWLALIKGENSIETGLLASAEGTSDPFTAAPPAYHSLLQEFADAFEPPGAPSPQQVAHRIDLVDKGAPAPRHSAYRMSPSELAEQRRQIHDILQKGWIWPSCSPYGAPLLFVRKKSKELHICIDYRMPNMNTKLDRFPIPRIDDLLDRLSKAAIFSKIDLTNTYHQVPI